MKYTGTRDIRVMSSLRTCCRKNE